MSSERNTGAAHEQRAQAQPSDHEVRATLAKPKGGERVPHTLAHYINTNGNGKYERAAAARNRFLEPC
jgi:hypothetical protein